jgi:hypothetical protein
MDPKVALQMIDDAETRDVMRGAGRCHVPVATHMLKKVA